MWFKTARKETSRRGLTDVSQLTIAGVIVLTRTRGSADIMRRFV